MTARSRLFIARIIGIVALFAALGPAVGGALFAPAVFAPPSSEGA